MRRSKLTREMQLYSTGKNSQTKPLRKTNIRLGRQAQLTFPLAPSGALREAALKEKPEPTVGSGAGSSFHTLWCVCFVFFFFQHLLTIALSSGRNTAVSSVTGSLFHQTGAVQVLF